MGTKKLRKTSRPRTMENEFKEWITTVYGGRAMTRVQREEMRKAFFCGGFIVMNIVREVSEVETTDVACTRLEILAKEMTTQIGIWCDPTGGK